MAKQWFFFNLSRVWLLQRLVPKSSSSWILQAGGVWLKIVFRGQGAVFHRGGNGVGYTILWWLLIVCISCVCWLLVGYLISSMLHLGFQQLWLRHCLWLRGVVIFLPADVLLFFVVKSCMSRLVVLIKWRRWFSLPMFAHRFTCGERKIKKSKSLKILWNWFYVVIR